MCLCTSMNREPVESKELLRAESLKNNDFFFSPVKVSVIYFQVLILFITKNEQNSFPKAGAYPHQTGTKISLILDRINK